MTIDFSVRTATVADGPAITALLKATYPVHFAQCYSPEILRVGLPLMTEAKPQLLASGTYYVAEIPGGVLVGCGGWSMSRPGTSDTVPELGHIRHFATHPDWAHRGIGRALLARCFLEARQHGVTALECFSSLGAEGFYRELGFTSVRPVQVELTTKVRLPVILMRREI